MRELRDVLGRVVPREGQARMPILQERQGMPELRDERGVSQGWVTDGDEGRGLDSDTANRRFSEG